jgi:hypothetical protein
LTYQFILYKISLSYLIFYVEQIREVLHMDSNGLSPEQQALLASIMSKSSQAGGGGGFSPSSVPAAGGAAAPAAAPSPADSGKMLSQAEIDALIASMGN